MELDDTVTLAGAEGIDLDLVLAGIGSRSAALLIDLGVQFLALLAAGFVAALFGDAGIALLAVAGFMMLFGYPVLMEAFAGGQTLGKRVLGIAVVSDDGTPVTFVAATIRNVVRLIDLLPGAYTVGLVAVLATKRSQRLGDLAAGTLVIHRARLQSAVAGPVPFSAGWDSAPSLATGARDGATTQATSGRDGNWAQAPFGQVGASTPPPPGWGGAPAPPPAEIATWDTSALSLDEVAAIRAFLGRRQTLDAGHRSQIADALARQLLPKVAGIPLDGGPELLLERIAYARAYR